MEEKILVLYYDKDTGLEALEDIARGLQDRIHRKILFIPKVWDFKEQTKEETIKQLEKIIKWLKGSLEDE